MILHGGDRQSPPLLHSSKLPVHKSKLWTGDATPWACLFFFPISYLLFCLLSLPGQQISLYKWLWGSGSQTVGQDPWGSVSNSPFAGITCQTSCISNVHIMIHNSNEITVMEEQLCGWRSAQHAKL